MSLWFEIFLTVVITGWVFVKVCRAFLEAYHQKKSDEEN